MPELFFQAAALCKNFIISVIKFIIEKKIALWALPAITLILSFFSSWKEHKKRPAEIFYGMIMDNSLIGTVLAVFLLLFFLSVGFKPDIEDLVDYKTLITVVVSFLIGVILMLLRRFWINRLEDSIKLIRDYKSLRSKYSAEKNWYSYKFAEGPENKMEEDIRYLDEKNIGYLIKHDENVKENKDKNEKRVLFPVIVDAKLIGKKLIIHDSKDKMYDIPNEISSYKDDLFKAHDTSHVYNQLNIRVREWKDDRDSFDLFTERTTYYRSLVTNRAIDYRLKNEMTVRDILQYGPFVPGLSESKLSNHLGFNGFIISSDNKIPLVKRNSDMSIGKHVFGPSVGASLKAKYCLNKEKELTLKGILEGIRHEINDELKIPLEDINSDEIELIAAYRDIVEGNKPQLLFYYKTNKIAKEINDNFIKKMKEKRKTVKRFKTREEQEEEDGTKFIWIDIKDLDKILYLPGELFVNGVQYKSGHENKICRKKCKSVPSTVMSLALFADMLSAGEIKI